MVHFATQIDALWPTGHFAPPPNRRTHSNKQPPGHVQSKTRNWVCLGGLVVWYVADTYFPPCHSSPHRKHRRLRNFSFLDRHSVNLGPEEGACATSLPVGAQRAEICSTRTCTRAHTRARTHMPCGPQDTAHRPQTRKRTLETAPWNSTAQNVQLCVSGWTCCVVRDKHAFPPCHSSTA